MRDALLGGGLPFPGYPLAWDDDPHIIGIAVLVAAPVQLAVAALGILARGLRLDPVNNFLVWAADVLLIATACGALAFLRTISWS